LDSEVKKYDVVIIGGGLAGLSLAYQLRAASSDLSILIIEKRKEKAPISIHKVGESIVELGSHYLRDITGLKDYLEANQLPKLGFRFFLSPEQNERIEQRVELGSRYLDPIPAHQIDRGSFENDLISGLEKINIEFRGGSLVADLQLSPEGHKIIFGKEEPIKSRWLIDASGRRSLLKRKLKLERPLDHLISAVWFRVGNKIDIDEWSEDQSWREYIPEGRRRLATNHLVGKGYWIWIIPLVSGNTSFGIVYDPTIHNSENFSDESRLMAWLRKNELQAHKVLDRPENKFLDLRSFRKLSTDSKQFFSKDRWAITGDAGVFLDPFYSPGTDFIALTNCWITDLVLTDMKGRSISAKTRVYELTLRQMIKGWISLYKDMYHIFGTTQIMVFKIVWDWGTYWGIPCLLFFNRGYTNLDVLKAYSSSEKSLGPRFSKLNENVQRFFRDWNELTVPPIENKHINVFRLSFLRRFHEGMKEMLSLEKLIDQIEKNLETLEQVAAQMFRLVSAYYAEDLKDTIIDPYTFNLDLSLNEPVKEEKSHKMTAFDAEIIDDLAKVWLISETSIVAAYDH
jgi:2-polyprenyl-6-methoxyphenol hydroxylase-like FAD-dependent oxidoreductase